MSAPHGAADPASTLCIVGTARRTWRPEDGEAPEPLAMWEEVARAAADDVGVARDPLAEIDRVSVVHCQSWRYDDPAGRLAERLGRPEVHTEESILAGTSPQRLIDAVAEAMQRGACGAALVVGAEALGTRTRYERAGETPPWSYPDPSSSRFVPDVAEWYLPTELRHGVVPAWLTFALLEQARWAARGGLPRDRERLGELMAALNRTAAANPDAWFRTERTAAELRTPSPDNRLVAAPYTKRMTAFPNVDMAAANLVVTRAVADAWGVPEERRVHLRGWGFARDASHVAARRELAASPAMRTATGAALERAGLALDEVDVFDLYSCFGSAVAFATDALGLADDDPRPLSVTGGLPYHGGPGSNYMSHSISHMVDRLRARPGEVGMVTGVGMHMTKHVAAVWSVDPGSAPPFTDTGPQQGPLPPEPSDLPVGGKVGEHVAGPVVVQSATTVHGRDGAPDHVVAICTLPDGRGRCYARSRHPDVIAAVASDAWIEAPASVVPCEDGTNDLWL